MALPSLTQLLLGKQYIGIEHFSLNNQEQIAVLLIEKKKEELVIVKKDKVTYTEIFPEKWDKKLPFFLVINTNQVIQKEILAIDSTDEKLLHKAFPNTNWDEFYFEIWRLKTKSIIAISRKIYVDKILSHYHKQGVSITGISLGACSIAELMNYTEEKELFTNHQTICWREENKTITATSSSNLGATYNINGLAVKNSHVLPFAGILRLLLNTTYNTGTGIIHSHQLYENYKQHSFFSKAIKIMIGILLTILLINFFAFTHYYTLSQETSESLLLSKSSLEQVAKTKKRVVSKEQKVKNVVAITSSQSSLIINEITKRIPQSILLTELIYHPLDKKIKTEESIIIQEKTVALSGTTINNEAFTHWIAVIEQLKWIDQVVITRFGKNDLNETEFSIKLILK
jgi:type II secretory pathway pseudopilin PulG